MKKENGCLFCGGEIKPTPEKTKRYAGAKLYCSKICRGKWHTQKSLEETGKRLRAARGF